jgi:hypothetical protein
MPSQIGNIGNVVDVTANYLVTKPNTRFATRHLQFFDIRVDGCHVNPYESDSLYSRAVRGVQVAGEIYAVGEPATDHFIVVLASDTTADPHNNNFDGNSNNGGAGYNPQAQSLQDAIGTICQDVTALRLSGNGFDGGRTNYSDESQNDC